ncbi:MAG: NADH-quinone oxidoreductase subunit, partial [Frankiales bacterium]|nr:NADH-quinone oxidoreductase subunit [Frankiales bacterium]
MSTPDSSKGASPTEKADGSEPAGRPVAADGVLPTGQGQDPSTDVLTASGASSASAAVGNVSTDAEARTDTPSETGDGKAAVLAPSPLASAVSAPAAPVRPGSDMFGATFGGDTSGFSGLVRSRPAPVSTPRPYGSFFDETVDGLEAAYPQFSEDVLRVVVDRGELTLHVRPESVGRVLKVLRDDPDQRYELLSSVSGVDYPAQDERLHVVYHLTSMTYRRRIRLETAVTVEDPHVRTATGVYPTADFHERETWDMFGIVFDGHPGLTRILMPDDWQGHPQRKDYP